MDSQQNQSWDNGVIGSGDYRGVFDTLSGVSFFILGCYSHIPTFSYNSTKWAKKIVFCSFFNTFKDFRMAESLMQQGFQRQ